MAKFVKEDPLGPDIDLMVMRLRSDHLGSHVFEGTAKSVSWEVLLNIIEAFLGKHPAVVLDAPTEVTDLKSVLISN